MREITVTAVAAGDEEHGFGSGRLQRGGDGCAALATQSVSAAGRIGCRCCRGIGFPDPRAAGCAVEGIAQSIDDGGIDLQRQPWRKRLTKTPAISSALAGATGFLLDDRGQNQELR